MEKKSKKMTQKLANEVLSSYRTYDKRNINNCEEEFRKSHSGYVLIEVLNIIERYSKPYQKKVVTTKSVKPKPKTKSEKPKPKTKSVKPKPKTKSEKPKPKTKSVKPKPKTKSVKPEKSITKKVKK